MSNKSNIGFEELAGNHAFRRWILNPADPSASFWEGWMKEDESRREVVEKARWFVLALEEQFGEITDEKIVQEDIRKLIDGVRDRNIQTSAIPGSRSIWRKGYFWRIAASLILMGSLGLWYAQMKKTEVPVIVQTYTGSKNTEWLAKTNSDDQPLTVLLSDGSVVMLEKGGELIYPADFSGKNRAVYLKGDAFFDVTKDARKPFLVFAGQTVTKVLGTSFRVRTNKEDGGVLVAVKTGRVSVYNQNEFSNDGADSATSVVLTPNEGVVFNAKAKKNEKEVIRDLTILESLPDDSDVVFEERPVSEVFDSIEKKYGIEIDYDEARLSACVVSTVFREEGLKQRLHATCTAIGATYSVKGEKVTVHLAKGCK